MSDRLSLHFLWQQFLLRKGQRYTQDFMANNCKLLFCDDADPGRYYPEVANFIAMWTQKEETKRVLHSFEID